MPSISSILLKVRDTLSVTGLRDAIGLITTLSISETQSSVPPVWETGKPKDLKASLITLKHTMAYSCDPGCADCCRRFGYIPVTPVEAIWLANKGATVWKKGSEWRFDIAGGCVFLKKNRCAIYDEPNRPAICQKTLCVYMASRLKIPGHRIEDNGDSQSVG